MRANLVIQPGLIQIVQQEKFCGGADPNAHLTNLMEKSDTIKMHRVSDDAILKNRKMLSGAGEGIGACHQVYLEKHHLSVWTTQAHCLNGTQFTGIIAPDLTLDHINLPSSDQWTSRSN